MTKTYATTEIPATAVQPGMILIRRDGSFGGYVHNVYVMTNTVHIAFGEHNWVSPDYPGSDGSSFDAPLTARIRCAA